jgi:hypothetical protein
MKYLASETNWARNHWRDMMINQLLFSRLATDDVFRSWTRLSNIRDGIGEKLRKEISDALSH